MGARSLLKQTTEIYLWDLEACPQKLSWVLKVRSEERTLQWSAHTAIFHIFLVCKQWRARHFFLVCSRIGHSSNLPERKPQWFSLFMPRALPLSRVTYPWWRIQGGYVWALTVSSSYLVTVIASLCLVYSGMRVLRMFSCPKKDHFVCKHIGRVINHMRRNLEHVRTKRLLWAYRSCCKELFNNTPQNWCWLREFGIARLFLEWNTCYALTLHTCNYWNCLKTQKCKVSVKPFP